jgi:hypothetical protein
MAVTGVVRKSPFDSGGENTPSRNVALEILGITLLASALVLVRFKLNDDLQLYAYSLISLIYIVLIFKNITYGTIIMIVAIGISPDSVGSNNVRYEDYLFPPLLIIWWFKRMSNQEALIVSEVNKSIKLYMLIVAIATIKGIFMRTVYSDMMAYAFCYKYIEYFLMFWFVYNSVRSREDVVLILIAAFVTCTFVAYIAYTGRAAHIEETGISFSRASGPEGETPNILGGYYMMNIMLGFAILFSVKNYIYKLIMLAFLVAVAVPLLYTYSRTSFASLLIGLVVTSLFIDLRFFIVLIILSFLAPLFFPVASFIDESFVDRYSSILDIFGDSSKGPSSWKARVSGWGVFFWGTWNSYPILGRGVGSVGLSIDGSYIKKFVETGIIGSVAFLLILNRLGRVGLENIRLSKDDFLKSYCIGYLGAFCGMLVHAIGVSSFSTIRTAEPFWIFSGLMVASGFIMKKAKELEEEEEEDWDQLSFVNKK